MTEQTRSPQDWLPAYDAADVAKALQPLISAMVEVGEAMKRAAPAFAAIAQALVVDEDDPRRRRRMLRARFGKTATDPRKG